MDKAASIDVIARDCIAVRMRMLNRVITNLYDEALRPLGVKVSQMNILVATAKLVLARPAQVCEILQLDTSTLSRNVERMRARGWLEVFSRRYSWRVVDRLWWWTTTIEQLHRKQLAVSSTRLPESV